MSEAGEPTQRSVIVVPCFNEAARLDAAAFSNFVAARPDVEFVFVNDGSTDDTEAFLVRLSASHSNLRHISLRINAGKAEAVRAGMLDALQSAPTFIGYWDADLATPLNVIPMLIDLLHSRDDVNLVMGSRVLMLGRVIRRRPIRHYLGRIFSTAVSLVTDIQVYDSQCGAKLMRADTLAHTVSDEPFVTRWLFDVEILLRVRGRLGSLDTVYEFPLPTWEDVAGSKVKRSDFARAAVELFNLRRKYMHGRARA